MSSAKITLASFDMWFNLQDDDLFKNLTLPEGIEKDVLTGNILMRGGEFEVLYSDPNFLQNLIGIWSRKWYRTFEKWITALNIEYNPLENYDRFEDWDDTRNNSGTENRTDTLARTTGDNLTRNTSDSLSRSTTDSGTTEHKVSAFDASTYQPSTEDTHSNSGSQNDTMTGTQTDVATGSQNDNATGNTTTSFGEAANHKGRIHGNIGTLTSQAMLQSELDIAEWNVYEHITDLFLQEFIIPIYS